MIEKNNATKIVWLILEINNLLTKYGDYICQGAGITTQQWLIMLYLAKDPNAPYFKREKHDKPLMASELADALNVSRPNITNLLNGLLKKGMVKQIPDEEDRRKKRLELAPEGIKLLAKLEPGRKIFNDNLLERFSEEERAQFSDFLENCNETIWSHFAKDFGLNDVDN